MKVPELKLPPDLKLAFWPVAEGKIEEADMEKKELVVCISTDCVDRDQEVLLPSGMTNTNYRKNPVVLWSHDYQTPAIGKSLWERIEKKRVLARPRFSQATDFAQEVFNLYADGTLRAISVGFLPPEDGKRPLTEDDVKENPEWAGAKQMYTSWDLWEYSCCNVPANPEALALALAEGRKSISPPLLEGLELPDMGQPFIWEKPYPNEHACRLRDPGAFQENSFRRMTRDHEGKTYSVIMGKLKGEDAMTEQAYRYDKDVWTVEAAQTHCKEHQGILFEAAKAQQDAELLARCKPRLIDLSKPLGKVVSPEELAKRLEAAKRGRVVL